MWGWRWARYVWRGCGGGMFRTRYVWRGCEKDIEDTACLLFQGLRRLGRPRARWVDAVRNHCLFRGGAAAWAEQAQNRDAWKTEEAAFLASRPH